MDILTRSPAKILKEKCTRGFDLFSPVRSKELFLLQERKFAALNLSIRRKRINLRDPAESFHLSKTSPSIKLFDNEEIFSFAEKSLSVLTNLQSPIKFRKRKYCNIINEERENYEPVDMSVDLSSPFIVEENPVEIEDRDSGCIKRARLSSKSF